VRVVGDERSAVDALHRLLRRAGRHVEATVRLRAGSEPDAEHRHRIARALELIRDGHIYQVNLARRIELDVRGRGIDLFSAMVRHARTPFGLAARLDDADIVSTSPELFVELAPDRLVRTRPIKGTRSRGNDAPEDARRIVELDLDPKERAELTMVIDVERNDLGRVAAIGSVRVPRAPWVETYGSVHHRVAEIVGRLRPELGRRDLLEAMLPSGSITGAPKVRAMEVIAALEAHRRGLYTGAFGVLAHDGSLKLAMAIRTLTVRDGEGHYFTGGGIVLDSDPEREVAETRWKAVQVTRLISGPGQHVVASARRTP
jgi:anthranilate/para-aminobenzoate synthase component I